MYRLILVLILLCSCAWKAEPPANQDGPPPVIIPPFVDSDGDLIADTDEEANGTDPFIADIPHVGMIGEITSTAAFQMEKIPNDRTNTETRVIQLDSEAIDRLSNPPLRASSIKEAFRYLRGDYANQVWRFDERYLNLVPVSKWTFGEQVKKSLDIDDYFRSGGIHLQKSGEIAFNYKIGTDGKSQQINGVKDIALNLFTEIDRKLSSLGSQKSVQANGTNTTIEFTPDNKTPESSRDLKMVFNELSPYSVSTIIQKDSPLYSSIDDMLLIFKSIGDVSFKTFMRGVMEKCARLVISKDGDTEVLYLNPDKLGHDQTLPSFLKQKYGDVEIDSTENILSIGDEQSEVIGPIDFSNLPSAQFEKKRWVFISETAQSIFGPIIRGKTYLFVLASLEELAQSSPQVKQVLRNMDVTHTDVASGRYSLGKVKPGDIVSLKFTGSFYEYSTQGRTAQGTTWRFQNDCSWCSISGYSCSTTTNNFGTQAVLLKEFHSFSECSDAENKPDQFIIAGHDSDLYLCGYAKKWCRARSPNKYERACTINYNERIINPDQPLPLTEDIGDYRINFVIGSKKHELSGAQDHILIGENKTLKLGAATFKIPTEDIGNIEEEAYLEIYPVEQSEPVRIGYMNDDCNWGDRSQFDTASSTFQKQLHQKFNITLSIAGMPRDSWGGKNE